ncbi:MAG TPA: hypothetical protein PKH31_15005 [Candidatus Sumerlaeota bacterium]|nr:hypothetical protein [Candidatus Sumerlaeota bacterium]
MRNMRGVAFQRAIGVFVLSFVFPVIGSATIPEGPKAEDSFACLSPGDLVQMVRKVYTLDPALKTTWDWRFLQASRESRAARNELGYRGDSAIESIVGAIHEEERQETPHEEFLNDLFSSLRGIQTPKARKALKELCLPLFRTNDPTQKALGFSRIGGPERIDNLASLTLQQIRQDFDLSEALAVFLNDPSEETLGYRVRGAVECLKIAATWPDAAIRTDSDVHRFGNRADRHYEKIVEYLRTLNARGTGDEIRREMTSLPDGVERDCLGVALAMRGEIGSQRPTLMAVLQNERTRTFPNLRLAALKAFAWHGETRDLDFLKELKASDPYWLEQYNGVIRYEHWQDEIINPTPDQVKQREGIAVESSFNFDERQKWITYPIRTEAQAAILEIVRRAPPNTAVPLSVEELIALAKTSPTGNSNDSVRQIALTELGKRGDEAVAPLVQAIRQDLQTEKPFQSLSMGYFNTLIRIDTEQARKARRTLGLALLQSPDRAQNIQGVQVVRGLALDEELFPLVFRWIGNEITRGDAWNVLMDDPSGNFTDRKIQAALDDLQAPSQWRDANRRTVISQHSFGNRADGRYCNGIWILSSLKGPDVNCQLKRVLETLPAGPTRDCLVVVLAKRDRFLCQRPALVKLLQCERNRAFPHLRMYAVEIMGQSGNKEDLPFLKKLADFDPYCYEDYLGFSRHERWGNEYLNLTRKQMEEPEMAFVPRQTIEDGPVVPDHITYPIRQAARLAIHLIQSRIAKEGTNLK